MKQLISIGTALSVLLLVTPSSVTAQNNPNTPSQNNPNRPNSGDLEKELTSIAESTLRLENDILVNGDPDSAIRRNPNAVRARAANIQYIYYYALTPNRDYRNFENAGIQGGDCTNFVSQALKAGGWPSEQGWYRSDTNWWYDFSFVQPGQSWTWINADYFFNFIHNRPRARTIGRVADLVPGDVISVDFDPQDGNGMDHTMLVSKKSNDGTIYVAYHTNNTLDKSFYQFYNAVSSNAKFYAWSLLSSYN